MNKIFSIVALVVAMGFGCQTANAQNDDWRGGYEELQDSYGQKANPSYNRWYVFYNKFSVKDAGVNGYKESQDFLGMGIGYLHGKSLSSRIPLYIEYGIRGQVNPDEQMIIVKGQIPVSVAYKLNFKNNFSVIPYLGGHFTGNIIAEGTGNNSVDWFSKSKMGGSSYTAPHFAGGMQVGVGVQYHKGYIGFEYSWDFGNYVLKSSARDIYINLGIIY